jgi:hypothetical protein
MILPEEQQEELQGLFFIMNINNRNFKRNYYKSPQITQIYTDMKFNAKSGVLTTAGAGVVLSQKGLFEHCFRCKFYF